MGSDLVISMKDASANGTTLFGVNQRAIPTQRHQLQRVNGQNHDLGERIHTSTLEIPQARQTYTVLGMQPKGKWGFTHGINEHRVTIGATRWQSRIGSETEALSGADLVRLALERSNRAHHAVEILTDLIGRHGQGQPDGAFTSLSDHIFVVADRDEAYLLEASGHFWALLECRHSRAVTDVAMIRQDWRKLAPGLADYAIEQGWWLDDGSKLDFVRCLGESTPNAKNALRRWGRASLALAQQQGAIDLHYLRRMLAEHYDNNQHLLPASPPTTLANSFLVDLQKTDHPILAWVSFGTPQNSVYFPISMLGELPYAWNGAHPECPSIETQSKEIQKLNPGKQSKNPDVVLALERLQARFDLDAEEFLAKAHECVIQGNTILLSQLATQMMHNHVEAFEKEYRRLFHIQDKPAAPSEKPEELLFFA